MASLADIEFFDTSFNQINSTLFRVQGALNIDQ